MSEYQSRMKGMDRPDFQIRKATGKRSMMPLYERHKGERLQGIGMHVVPDVRDGGANQPVSNFNPKTMSFVQGRKR